MPWTNDGVLVVNADGAVIECADCPCGPLCSSCADVLAFFASHNEVEVTFDLSNAAFGTNCNGLDGTYLTTYMADPSAIDDGGGTLADYELVWVYELPAPVTIRTVGAANVNATHIFFGLICDFGTEVLLAGYRMITVGGPSDGAVSIQPMYGKFPHDYNTICLTTGTLPAGVGSTLCIAPGTMPYELFP